MLLFNIFTRRSYFSLLKLCLIIITFQGCKIYKEPISITKAVNSEETSVIKITMLNGDEFIYNNIELIEDNYYGVYFKDGEKGRTLLNKDDIKYLQQRNVKASKGSNGIGIGLGVLSTVFVVLMI